MSTRLGKGSPPPSDDASDCLGAGFSRLYLDDSLEARQWVPRGPSGFCALQNVVKLMLVLRGTYRVQLGSRRVAVPRDRLAAHWGGLPHWQLTHDSGTELIYVQVPMSLVSLTPEFAALLYQGELVSEPDPSPERARRDRALMEQWVEDLHVAREFAAPPHDGIVAQEVSMRLRRLSSTHLGHGTRASHSLDDVLVRACRIVGERFREDISVSAIAAEVGLHPKSLSRLVSRRLGVRLWDYVVMLRLRHAQQLLLTTDLSVSEVALRSGFNSTPWFYRRFRLFCGASPGQFRVATQRRSLHSPSSDESVRRRSADEGGAPRGRAGRGARF